MGSNHVGASVATHNCVVCVETPASRTQVFMYTGGELAVHDNVVFEANTAGEDGGAVSRPLEIAFHPSVVVCFSIIRFARVGSIRDAQAPHASFVQNPLFQNRNPQP